jgi:hypothetical protein
MELDPVTLNVQGVTDLVSSKINKVPDGVLSNTEGVESEKLDILTLDLDDDELLKLKDKWEANYASYEAALNKRQKANKQYYLGRQAEGTAIAVNDLPLASNLLFEAEETFLPAALSKNPDPVVYSDNTDEGNKISNDIKTMLQYHADQLVLRRKLTHMVRQWSIYFLGVIKHGWNDDIKDIRSDVRKIQDFIFDPNGCVDDYGDFDSYLGERITVTSEKLIELFPEHSAYIKEKVEFKLGTDCTYTEWWTDKYCFVTFKDKILDKHKNEFFKYDEGEGEELTKGQNHFAIPKKPYTFLSVFTLGDQPQNIPNQNLVTKRTYQIDKNLSRSNNSVAYSENNFNQETAKQAATAFEKGHPVLVPSGGPIADAIVRFPAEGFPDSAFKELETNKANLRTIFGTQGITAQEPTEDTTARGMILNQQYDNTRIGGGIGDALAQVADNIFNWWVQLYYVYYDEPHRAAILGQNKAVEYVTLVNSQFTSQLIVSVAPDSLKPKDELTIMNQALQLWGEGVLDPKSLFNILNFPNPNETAESTVLWLIDKNAYLQLNFPELVQQLQQVQPQQGAPGGQPAPGGAPGATPLAVPPTTGGAMANPSLSQVPLPV